MNILFLSQIVPYPPHGGVLQRGYNLIREIGKYNSLHLLAFIHPETLNSQELITESRQELLKHCTSVHYFRLWPKQSSAHKIAAYASALLFPQPFSVLAHRSAAYRQAVLHALNTQDIDLVHVDTIGLAPYRELVTDLPCVLTHHNIESALMKRRAQVERSVLARAYVSLQAKRLRAFEAEQSPRFDVNIMVSPNDRGDLLDIAPGVSTALIPNGVDIDYFSPAPAGDEPAVIYTGGMNMYANRDAVLYFLREIWPLILNNHPNAHFYAIGQDPPRELRNIANHTPGVIVTGFVDDIRPFVRKAAVYVVPLRVGGGTRLKVLDALAQGKAIVSTSVGCEGISVNHGTDILIEDDPKEFAARVSNLLSDTGLRQRLGRAARQLAVKSYSWHTIGKDLQYVYEVAASRATFDHGAI